MSFELVMLLGFFGMVLLSLLPATPAETAGESFRGRRQLRRSDTGERNTARHGRVARNGEATRRRSPGHVAV